MTTFTQFSVQFEPLQQWPKGHERTPASERKRSPFRSTYGQTLKQLEKELRMVGADAVVIQVDIPEGSVRLDGMPYANARFGDDPGVVLSFETEEGRFMYPCDTFRDWKENLRAIALTLEKLRAVDRYGVAQRGEQYVGWKAIPEDVDSRLTVEDAANIVARTAGIGDGDVAVAVMEMVEEASTFRHLYRQASKYAHPDRPGGTEAAFQRLQTARQILEEHHE